MKLEDQLTNLEISQKLESLGVKQDSLYYWCRHRNDKNFYIYSKEYLEGEDVSRWKIEQEISAFTVAELGEMLPKTLSITKELWLDTGYDPETKLWGMGYYRVPVTDIKTYDIWQEEESEVDVRGKLLIYLLENKLYDI